MNVVITDLKWFFIPIKILVKIHQEHDTRCMQSDSSPETAEISTMDRGNNQMQ